MTSIAAEPALWFRNFVPAPDAAVRLVCLPHAGGSAPFYLPVAQALAPDVDVIAAQYPGRQDRRHERCLTSMTDLADEVAAAVLPWCDRPLALFGHSMGATLAFELARRLDGRAEVDLRHLFVSGRRAPSCPHDDGVHACDDEGLLREMKALNGTSAAVLADEEILRMAMPAIRADYAVAEGYVFDGGPAPTTDVTVLTGDRDPKTSIDQAQAWSTHTSGRFDLQVYPGGHFFLTDHAAALICLLRERLTGTAG